MKTVVAIGIVVATIFVGPVYPHFRFVFRARRCGDQYLRRCAEARRQGAVLDGPDELEAEATLNVELPNLMDAAPMWLDDEAVEGVAEPILRVFMGRGLIRQLCDYANRLLSAKTTLLPAARTMILAYRGRAQAMLGDLAAGQADFDAAIGIGRAHRLQYPLAYAQVYAAGFSFHTDQLETAQHQLLELEPLIAALDDTGISMRARYNAGLVLDAMGKSAESEQCLREALVLARRLGAPASLAAVQTLLAHPLLRQGRFVEAEALLREALSIVERIARKQDIAFALNSLALAVLWRSNGAEAQASARDALRALELFEQIGHAYGESGAADTLGLAMMALGRFDEARTLFERAAAIGTPLTAGDAKFHLALLHVEQDRPGAATALAVELLDSTRRHNLDAIARRVTLLTAAIAGRADRRSPAARRWLLSLLADVDLEFELRQRAAALLAQLEARSEVGDQPPLSKSDLLTELDDFLLRK